ncbi:MAG TPA: hypothetical protein VEC01_15835 [Noviherbaspirillum sp.]|uniref:hypothetical protein n=1 Tax=Noviherbaspirillum sp. TaxID=1926288 RepID=UPI002D614378|nr:hypothetical protein [Noviherbaspirillum sp.]HYD96800.1 hypothetical protein [Noviherbaspirillum sp.]
MTQTALQHAYDPNRLLNTLIDRLGVRSDNALSRRLKVAGNVIRDMRDGRIPVAGSMLLWMQEVTGISVDELRGLLGDRRAKCRLHYGIRTAGA